MATLIIDRQKRRPARWRMKKSPWKAYVLLMLMLISTVSTVRANGDLKNSGTINNSGKIRVQNQAQGLPAVNGGMYEFFGGNQSIPGRQYVDLKLSGTGTKTADADATVTGTLTVASGVTYDTGPFTTHLTGTLAESGYVTGKLDKTLTLSGGFGTSSFGNIGASITWSSIAPGNTTVVRTSGTALSSVATGKSSIKRYYDITPATNTNLDATLVFKYADVELNGQTAAILSLWKSTDGGATWRNQGGTVDAVQRTITKTGIGSFSRWTASDAAHPLGSMSIEGVAGNLAMSMGNGQTGLISTTLPMQLVVTATDAFGSPVKNTAVTFTITGSPSGAVGQSLSVINTVTDNLGQASTSLTLGDKIGTYTVSATSPFIAGSLVTFSATGIKALPVSVATSLGLTSGNNQTQVAYSNLPQPYVVTVLDQFGSPMAGVAVKFALVGSPAGAVGQKLIDTLVTTNGAGQAQTSLKLGTKVGAYTVTASSGTLTGSPVTFRSNAIAGAAANVTLPLGTSLAGVVLQTVLPAVLVQVTDAYGNPISGASVRYLLTSSPTGSTGTSPQDVTVATDSLGRSQISLVVGTKAGVYTFQVSVGSLAPQTITVTATGGQVVAVASRLVQTSGSGQSGVVSTQLVDPFVVTVLDQYGNPYAGATVRFAITGTPSGDSAAVLSSSTVVTAQNGQASVRLTLGKTVGVYTVSASSDTLTGSPVQFTAVATGSQTGTVASRLVQTSGSGQSGVVTTQLASPLVVTVVDTAGNPVSGVSVHFALGTSPSGSAGQVLSVADVATNASGRAQTVLTLGTKAGQYTVTASSGTLIGSPVTFTATATPGSASRLAMISGDKQTATASTVLTQPFVVQVTDNQQNAIGGVVVNFAIGSIPSGASGQVLDASQKTTDSQGLASVTLTLGDKAGDYRVDATSLLIAGGIVSFTGTATSTGSLARTLLLSSGQDQSGVVRSILPQPFVVRTVDANNNPVSGVSVQFAIDTIPSGASGQSLSTVSATSDLLGYASTLLTFGDLTGTYTVRATSTGLTGSPLTFRATATSTGNLARTLLLSSGQDQQAVVRSILPQPFVVRTVDANNNPVSGISVQFGIDAFPAGASGQSLSQTSATTDQLGLASTLLTLGDMTGTYTVRATSSGLTGSPLTLRAVATLSSGAMGIVYSSGDGQSAGVLSQLSSPLVATVFGADGSPVAGQVVTFAIDSLPGGATGQVLSTSSATTDAQGRATTVLTLGNKIGTYRVSASVSGLSGSPVIYRLVSTVGLPKTLALVQGSGQTKPIGTTLDNAFVVRVLDVASNPVPGVTVQFSLDTIPSGSSGQSLHVVNSLTDAQGQSQAVLTLGSKVGSYVVTATSSGLSGSPLRFSARATAGSAAVVLLSSGDAQTAPVSTELLSPYVVTVTDIGGNLVTGTAVVFAIETTPSGSRGQALRILNSLTDAQGQALAYLTVGDREGRYTVTATVTGFTPIRFSSTATVLVGDLNGDNAINIADLTTVIDYILGKITLTGSDSVKADFNKDGHIDIRDVVAMQNYLLAITGISTQVGTGTGTEMPAVSSTVSTAVDTTVSISGEFVLTENGVRFNLTNSVPVKGLQLIIRFKDAQNVVRPDEIFDRAKVDSFYVNSSGRELRIVAYNMGNVPIAAGSGALFRLPVRLTDVSGIELGQMIISRTNNVAFFDEALTKSVPVRLVTTQDLPTTFVLYQNYPNPFNGQTKIDYEVVDVAGMVEVSVQVYNVLGERVKTLITERHAGGRFTVRWDGTDDRGTKLSSGTYYYRLISGDFVSSKKMIMLK